MREKEVAGLRVVIIENTAENLERLANIIREIEPNARVTGFTDGEKALKWCTENAFSVDVFIGNWWGTEEAATSPEGANVYKLVRWYKKPAKILIADEPMFEKWSYQDGAIGFIRRPATMEKVQEIFRRLPK